MCLLDEERQKKVFEGEFIHMKMTLEFSPSVIENLGFYVYFLKNPDTKEVFYVGKGCGNRVFSHLQAAIETPEKSDKLELIRSIQSKGLQVECIIHRHGLTENEAYEVEASLIDFIGIEDLSNITKGHYSDFRGSMSIPDVIALYDAPTINITVPAILVRPNRLYKKGINPEELYEITRGNWALGERRNRARYAIVVYNGLIREVYEINRWFQVEARFDTAKKRKRWRFEGSIAQDLQHYIGCNVKQYFTIGARGPFKYINC